MYYMYMSQKKKLPLQPIRVMKMVAGIDEVGRGAFAGPVSVGVLCMKTVDLERMKSLGEFKGLRDSKKLTPVMRAVWFNKIKKWRTEKLLDFCVTHRASHKIDSEGLTKSIQFGINTGLKKLSVHNTARILLDGGLKAPKEFGDQQTIIKGDEKEIIISLASIAAKETRDALMKKLCTKFPVYGFSQHVGYGTKKHLDAIKEKGICVQHRKLFLRKFDTLSKI